ncbi:MAG: hypothetical protein B6244_07285 [Candidatus Cloacimonetes bacterium 4572_55]|nr:MAG: hypothetical protein B6244_07285 [Candidatus Cloacimonetes bacterium 4572_55]
MIKKIATSIGHSLLKFIEKWGMTILFLILTHALYVGISLLIVGIALFFLPMISSLIQILISIPSLLMGILFFIWHFVFYRPNSWLKREMADYLGSIWAGRRMKGFMDRLRWRYGVHDGEVEFQQMPTYLLRKEKLPKLKKEGIPTEITNKLEGICNLKFFTKQALLDRVKGKIGDAVAATHKEIILKHAEKGYSLSLFFYDIISIQIFKTKIKKERYVREKYRNDPLQRWSNKSGFPLNELWSSTYEDVNKKDPLPKLLRQVSLWASEYPEQVSNFIMEFLLKHDPDNLVPSDIERFDYFQTAKFFHYFCSARVVGMLDVWPTAYMVPILIELMALKFTVTPPDEEKATKHAALVLAKYGDLGNRAWGKAWKVLSEMERPNMIKIYKQMPDYERKSMFIYGPDSSDPAKADLEIAKILLELIIDEMGHGEDLANILRSSKAFNGIARKFLDKFSANRIGKIRYVLLHELRKETSLIIGDADAFRYFREFGERNR